MEHEPFGIEAPRAPSGVARARLSSDVQRELADLRTRLAEARLRSEVFLSAGRPDAAARVVDEQRRMVSDFSRRVDAAVSAAVVEREAEQVLADELASQLRPEPARPSAGVPVGAVLAGLVAFALVVAGVVRTTPDLDLASTTEGPASPPDGRSDLAPVPDVVPTPDVGERWARPGLRWFLVEPPAPLRGASALGGAAGTGPIPDDPTLIAQLLAGADGLLHEPLSILEESTDELASGDDASGADDGSTGAIGSGDTRSPIDEADAAGGQDTTQADGAAPRSDGDTGSSPSPDGDGGSGDDADESSTDGSSTSSGGGSASATDVVEDVSGVTGTDDGVGASADDEAAVH